MIQFGGYYMARNSPTSPHIPVNSVPGILDDQN